MMSMVMRLNGTSIIGSETSGPRLFTLGEDFRHLGHSDSGC